MLQLEHNQLLLFYFVSNEFFANFFFFLKCIIYYQIAGNLGSMLLGETYYVRIFPEGTFTEACSTSSALSIL